MRTVTYGVTGLIDWNAQIPVGRARLSVHFSGGAITKYGVTPAEYTTCDPITQRIIEDSEYYRSGKIRILRSAGRAEPVALSRRNDLATREAYEAATLPFDNNPVDRPGENGSPSQPTHGLRPGEDAPHPRSGHDTHAENSGQPLHFACVEDARTYLIEQQHIPPLKLTSKAAIEKTAAELGITIIIDRQ